MFCLKVVVVLGVIVYQVLFWSYGFKVKDFVFGYYVIYVLLDG